jgi:hypothetical protein
MTPDRTLTDVLSTNAVFLTTFAGARTVDSGCSCLLVVIGGGYKKKKECSSAPRKNKVMLMVLKGSLPNDGLHPETVNVANKGL